MLFLESLPGGVERDANPNVAWSKVGGRSWRAKSNRKVVVPPSSRLRPTTDLSAADWVVAGVGPFGSGVGGILPHGFESYARILHPAASTDTGPVRWAEVAAWSGGTLHARVQFDALARPRNGGGRGRAPWEQGPESGRLTPELLSRLCPLLAGHTQAAQQCWFCLWEGYGWIHGSPMVAVVSARRGPASGSGPLPAVVPPALPREIIDGPRVRLPQRACMLFEGPLEAASEMGHRVTDDWFIPQSPNLFWPEDRAWCVATEVDLDSTYLGGSARLVRDLLSDANLEAFEVELGDHLWADSGDINR